MTFDQMETRLIHLSVQVDKNKKRQESQVAELQTQIQELQDVCASLLKTRLKEANAEKDARSEWQNYLKKLAERGKREKS